MCRAANTQGSVSSNDLYLDIKCKLIDFHPSVLTGQVVIELGVFIAVTLFEHTSYLQIQQTTQKPSCKN